MRLTNCAFAASLAAACVSAGCAEIPLSGRAADTAGPAPQSCGLMSDADADPAALRDCARIYAELRGRDTVTLEFSDRYQAVAVPIQIYTMSWITHVDFVLPDGRLLGATPLGVRIRHWTPAIHTVRYTFHADAQKVLGYALSQLGRPYDFVGLAGYAMKIGFLHQDGSWFCSALVEASALHGGVDLSGKSPHMTSPAQLAASALLTRVTAPVAKPAYTTVAEAPAALGPHALSLKELSGAPGF